MNHSATQTAILETARRLFNEQGYGRVSMRQIAAEMQMAVGNLTYYFPQKQMMVTALMDESFEQARMEEPIESLAQVNELLSHMLDTLMRHPFYFLDPEFAEERRLSSHHAVLRDQLFQGFENLIALGRVSRDFDAEKRRTVLGLLLMTHLSWLRSTVRGTLIMDQQAFLDAHWTVLEPWLTEEGRRELEAIRTI